MATLVMSEQPTLLPGVLAGYAVTLVRAQLLHWQGLHEAIDLRRRGSRRGRSGDGGGGPRREGPGQASGGPEIHRPTGLLSVRQWSAAVLRWLEGKRR